MGRGRRSELALMVLLAPLGLLVILTLLLFRAYWIPSGSMKPTLLVGDYLLVNRAAYGFPALMCRLGTCDGTMGPIGGLPDRGDVVTFIHPVAGYHYIKRVIGLPGDTVQMAEGKLVLNGTAVPQTTLAAFSEPYILEDGYLACNNAPVAIGGTCLKDQMQEALPGGRQYRTISAAQGLRADSTEAFEVPQGHVFVVGDNRDNSLDSRFPRAGGGLGMVPLENMIGRADLILFSLKGQKGRALRWVE